MQFLILRLLNLTKGEKLFPIANRDMLTLLTCDPATPPSPYRLLVNCDRLEEKTEKTNTSETKRRSK